jgi:hypothetical protein
VIVSNTYVRFFLITAVIKMARMLSVCWAVDAVVLLHGGHDLAGENRNLTVERKTVNCVRKLRET